MTRSCSSTGQCVPGLQVVDVLLDDHVAAAGEGWVLFADQHRVARRPRHRGSRCRPRTRAGHARRRTGSRGPRRRHVRAPARRSVTPLGELEAEIQTVGPDVEQEVARVSRERRGARPGSRGRGGAPDGPCDPNSRSHADAPIPTTHVNSPSGMRNPTDRFSPLTSPSSSRSESSPPASIVTVRKIAASVRGVRMAWGSGAGMDTQWISRRGKPIDGRRSRDNRR